MPMLDFTQLDPSKITLGATGRNSKGGKYVPLLYNGKDAIETKLHMGLDAPVRCPFGLDTPMEEDAGPKLKLPIALPPALEATVRALDEAIPKLVAPRAAELFGGPKTELQLLDAYKPLFKPATKEGHAALSALKVKWSSSHEDVKKHGKPTPVKLVTKVDESQAYVKGDSEALVKNCGVVAQVRLGSVWVTGKTAFGVTLEAVELFVYPPADAPSLADLFELPAIDDDEPSAKKQRAD